MAADIVLPERFEQLVDKVAIGVNSDPSFRPNMIVALSTGGFPVAAALAKRVGVPSGRVIGIPVHKDESDDYHLDEGIIHLGRCDDLAALVVDDASNRGLLTKTAVDVIIQKGGSARSAVLVAWEGGVLPDYVGDTCTGKPSRFFWEPSTQN